MGELRIATVRILSVIMLIAASTAASSASANPAATDRTVTLEKGRTLVEWAGEVATGTNLNYFEMVAQARPVVPPRTCSKDRHTYCESVLVTIENPFDEADFGSGEIRSRRVLVTLGDYAPAWMSDFDLCVYSVGSDGARGREIGRSTEYAPAVERVNIEARFHKDTASVSVIVDVVYWAVAGSGYKGTVSLPA